jgi:hypothetical protein
VAAHDVLTLAALGQRLTHPTLAMTAPVTDAASREVLKAGLLDEQGLVRLPVAQALTWSHMRSHEGPVWRGYLDEQLASQSLSRDQRASWLLARAFDEAAYLGPEDFQAIQGRPYMEQALAAAETEPVRLACVTALCVALADSGQHEEARSLLESVSGQFVAAEALAAVGELRTTLDTLAESQTSQTTLEREQKAQEALEANLLQGQLEHYQILVREAEQAGRGPSEVQSLQLMTDNVRRRLDEVQGAGE